MDSKLKYAKYPGLNFVDPDILDFWKKTKGTDPDWWDHKEILLVQIIRSVQNMTTQGMQQ